MSDRDIARAYLAACEDSVDRREPGRIDARWIPSVDGLDAYFEQREWRDRWAKPYLPSLG